MFETKESLAKELLQLMGMRDKYESAAEIVSKNFAMYGIGDILKEAALSTIDDLMEDVARIYADRLEKATLKKIVKFYRSSAGKQFSNALTTLNAEIDVATGQWQLKIVNKAQQLVYKQQSERGFDATPYIPPIDKLH